MVQAGACRRPSEEVALGRSGARAGIGCGDWMTVMGRQRHRERSRDRLVTGDDGSLDYPLTRARVTPIIYFGVTTCHQRCCRRPLSKLVCTMRSFPAHMFLRGHDHAPMSAAILTSSISALLMSTS